MRRTASGGVLSQCGESTQRRTNGENTALNKASVRRQSRQRLTLFRRFSPLETSLRPTRGNRSFPLDSLPDLQNAVTVQPQRGFPKAGPQAPFGRLWKGCPEGKPIERVFPLVCFFSRLLCTSKEIGPAEQLCAPGAADWWRQMSKTHIIKTPLPSWQRGRVFTWWGRSSCRIADRRI